MFSDQAWMDYWAQGTPPTPWIHLKDDRKEMQNGHKAQQQKRPQTDAKWAQSCEATTTSHKTTNEKLKCTTGRHRLKPKSERIDHKISQTTTNWCKPIPKRCTMSVTRCKTTDGCGLGFQSEGLAHRRRSSGLWWACVQGPVVPRSVLPADTLNCIFCQPSLPEITFIFVLPDTFWGKGNFAWIMLFSIWGEIAMFWSELWLAF